MFSAVDTTADAKADSAPQAFPLVPAKMKAIAYDDYGGVDRLKLIELPSPAKFPGSVLIRVHAAGVNPIDGRLRRGEAKWILPGGFPRIPGYDVAGQVIEGDFEAGLQPGDRVLAFLNSMRGGGYAEYARCAVSGVAKIPSNLSYEEAAAIPLAGSTALQSLRDKGAIKREDRVLINGASGGVGSLAVQIAKDYGGRVTAVASGENEEFVRQLGADEYIDYQQYRFTQVGRSWQLIFDVAGTSSFWKSRRSLVKGGRFISTEPALPHFLASLITTMTTRRGRVILAKPNAGDLGELIALCQSGNLRVTIADVLPLASAAEAQHRLAAGGHRGKYVLRIPWH